MIARTMPSVMPIAMRGHGQLERGQDEPVQDRVDAEVVAD